MTAFAPDKATTGPLTAPLEIIRAASARHRIAVAEHATAPAWMHLATVALAGLAALGAFLMRDPASPILAAAGIVPAIAVALPDLLAALPTSKTEVGAE